MHRSAAPKHRSGGLGTPEARLVQCRRLAEAIRERPPVRRIIPPERGDCLRIRQRPRGQEPEHWEVRRLKQVSTIQAGLTLGKAYRNAELIERPYLRVANVQSGHLDLSEITTVQVPLAEVKRTTLEIGDVLMTEGGDIDKLGRGCMWEGEIPGCLHQNHVFAVRPNPTDLNPAFLLALMGTMQGRNYFHATAKQTTNLLATNRTTLGEFPMYLPSIREQQLS